MKILQAHNYYQQPGGEDTVVSAERRMLESRGHEVVPYAVHNDAIRQINGVSAALATIWNRQTVTDVTGLIQRERPDVIHAHNTFPLISPSLYGAAAQAGIPVVQTLHNYRLLCPASTFYRDGRICEDCLGHLPIHGLVHACYRNSVAASATTAAMLTVHRALGTWRNRVSAYIALSEFARRKFVRGGLPEAKLWVKPNFLPDDPGVGFGRGGYVLFAGRLVGLKGVLTLLDAWRKLPEGIRLKVAGDGPLMPQVRAAAAAMCNVEVLGACSREQVLALVKEARAIAFPSEWYEGMPMSLVEAGACGTPAIVSDLESLDEFAFEGMNAVRFSTGNAESLATRVHQLMEDELLLQTLREGARGLYCERFSAERNFPLLMQIYEQALARNSPVTGKSVLTRYQAPET